MRKLTVCSLLLLFLLAVAVPAEAEVKTFGFNDNRTRTTEGADTVFWASWKDDSGVSYSQPLILKGWGEYTGKTLVVAVTGNQLRGYVCLEPEGTPGGVGFRQNFALWSIALSGSSETKSHPTLVEKSGRKYVYIGTDTPGYLHIIDITDFSKAEEVRCVKDYYSKDIVSAPLVLHWKGHEVVVYTVGNNPSVHLAIDPIELAEPNIIEIKIGNSGGRTSSTPGPVLGGQGFVVGLDRGGSAKGEMQVYKLDDILAENEDGVFLKSKDAFIVYTTHSSVVASFCTDSERVYFGDMRSRVYCYDLVHGEKWINSDCDGVFSNRSPALTANTIYFPVTGNTGEAGKILAVDRLSGSTNWIVPFETRAQTAPIVWRNLLAEEATVLAGTSGGYLGMIDAYNGKKYNAVSIASGGGGSAYAGGVSGELSAAENWLVATTTSGIIAWQARPFDLAIVSLEPGCPSEGGVYKAVPGTRYTATAVVRALNMPFEELPVTLGAFNEIGGVSYQAVLTDIAGNEISRRADYYSNYCEYMNRTSKTETTVLFDWTASPGEQYLTMAANLDYPGVAPLLRNIWPEKTLDNNMLRIPITTSGYDVKISITPDKSVYEAISGTVGVKCRATVTRKDSIAGNIQAKVTVSGGSGTGDYTVTLGPGGSETIEYSFPGSPRLYTIVGEAWPIGFEDVFPGDNKAQINIRVNAGAATAPALDGGIRVGL